MWKKILATSLFLLGTVLITYMYVNNIGVVATLHAQSAPSFNLQSGQKIVLGEYNGNEIIWDIGKDTDDYVIMSSKPITNMAILSKEDDESNNPNKISTTIQTDPAMREKYCLKYFNKNIYYIPYCPVTPLKEEVAKIQLTSKETPILNLAPFLPTVGAVMNGGTLGLTTNDRAYKDTNQNDFGYWLDGAGRFPNSADDSTKNGYFNIRQVNIGNSVGNADRGNMTVLDTGEVLNSVTNMIDSIAAKRWPQNQATINTLGLRPFATIDRTKINFAANTSYTDGNWHSYEVDTVNLNLKNELNPNKLRIVSNLTASLNNIKYKAQTTQKVVKDSTITLSVDANTGTNTRLSILLYNEAATEIKYYKLGDLTKSGLNEYSLDLTGVAVGKYQLAVINEEYEASSQLPVESSAISNIMPLEIIESHKLTYTKQPQSGASSGKEYEFSKNVNAGQTIGTIIVNRQGLMPLTYTVESNGDNTYQNFEIDGLNSSGASTGTSLNVKIKSNGPDVVNGSLKAGNHKFCVSAVDMYGDPVPETSDSKVCTTLVVAKTNLTVSFDDQAQTTKSIAEAGTAWSETATANPKGPKITYEVTGGDFGLIDIDADTGRITYKGNGDFGKVEISATAADDPSSGNDNYLPATTKKEIIIYKEVNGVVNPASGSKDNTIPTFTANQANVQMNGKVAKITGMPGTPTTIGGSNYEYTYGLKPGGNANFFAVNASTGDITTKGKLSVGEYHFTVTVSDHWSSKDLEVTVKVEEADAEPLYFYETSAAVNMITKKSVSLTDTGVKVYATVKGSTNPNPVKYRIKGGSTGIIEVNESTGAVTIHSVGTTIIVAEKQGISGQANAIAELEFTVTAGAQNFIYTDEAGNELTKTGDAYAAYSEVYAKGKSFQLYTAGNPTGSSVTYRLKAGSPTDVIAVDANGSVTVLNATLTPSQIGRVIVEAVSHDPSGNFSDKIIELPINITKAQQTISFKEVTYVANGDGSVDPIILEQDISSNEGGASVPDMKYYISVDTSVDNNIAYTNDGKTIHYSYSEEEGKDIQLHVLKQGNRNYEKAEADGTLHILGSKESELAVTNMGRIIYGDHFTISSLQDDSSSTNVQYQFEVDNTTYISNPTINGNSAEFDALKASGNVSINIKVTRTADSEKPLSKLVSVQVLPKSIEIIVDNKDRLKGEANPVLTYQDFRSKLVSWNGTQDIIQENDIKLSTTAKASSEAGGYAIKGDATALNRAYPNYTFKYKDGTLIVNEDVIEDDWYHLEINDGNNTAYAGKWTNQDVNIISDHIEYINLSLDQSTWKPNEVTVSKEGETNQSFWMKKESGAITKEKEELVKIDKTAPKVKGIKAKDTNNKLQDIINKISGGIFFKPGTAFEITTSDAKDNLKVSGTKEISYKVYKLDTVARSGEELMKEGKLSVTKEKASITISETTGKYKVCVIATDNAGNTNTESCHELELKKIDVDVDGDGKPDFNDPDGDGCPDLNIKWKDTNDESKWIVINGDRDGDGIPDLNIDSNGDGKPELNIDTDHDGKPDLNLVILKKTDWKPTKCVKQDIDNGFPEEYCTGTSVKAVINVDTDDDGIPNINIDNQGDFKPHINISKDAQKPMTNIAIMHSWKPIKDYKQINFTYDSVGKEIKPSINIDSDEDGRPDINIDLDGDNVPDINIDSNGDGIPDISIDSDGDGKPDVNVDTDGDGKADENIKEITEWKPDKNVDGDFQYDTMVFDEGDEPEDPEEPTTPDKPNNPTQDGNDTDVKGVYYPGTSIGGAITGDDTNVYQYIIFSLVSLCVLALVYRKVKALDKN